MIYRSSPAYQIISGALYPLPWIFAASAYSEYVKERTSSPLGQSWLQTRSHGIADMIFLISAITSSTLLSIYVLSAFTATPGTPRWTQNGKPYPKSRADALTIARELGWRVCGLVAPIFASFHLGGLCSALPLVLILSSGLGCSNLSPSAHKKLTLRRKSAEQKPRC